MSSPIYRRRPRNGRRGSFACIASFLVIVFVSFPGAAQQQGTECTEAPWFCGPDRIEHSGTCDPLLLPIEYTGACTDHAHVIEGQSSGHDSMMTDRLNADMIKAMNQTQVADLIAAVPGVAPLRLGRASSGFQIRSLSGRNTAILIDGLRVNTALLTPEADPVLSLFDPLSLYDIEVERGPATSGVGTGALGGVVRLRSRQPTLIDDGVRGEVQGRFAFAELERSGSGRFEVRQGGFDVLGGVSALQTSELRSGSGEDATTDGFTQVGGDARVQWSWNETELAAHYSTQRQIDLADTVGSAQVTDRARDLAWLGFRHRDADGYVTDAEARIGVQRHGQSIDLDGNTGDEQVVSVSAVANAETPIGGRVAATWLMDVTYQMVSRNGSGVDSPEFASVVDGSDHLTADVGSKAVITLGESTWLDLSARLGWTHGSIPAEEDLEGVDLTELSASGAAALQHRFGEFLLTELRAATGLAYPNLRDLVRFQRTSEATLLPNPDLTGEQLIGVDLGLALTLAPFFLEVTAEYAYWYDLISAEPTGELDPENLDNAGRPLPYVQRVNLDEAQLINLEAKSRVEIADMLVYLDLAWTMGDDLGADEPLRNVPPFNGRTGISYQGPTWDAGAYLRFSRAQDRLAVGEDTTQGYSVLGLRGQVRFLGWARAVLTLDNLFDQRYRLHGSSIDEPGFNATVTLAADWF